MNTHRILAIIITAFFVAASAPCPASDNEGGRSIAIELKDGSRIVGKSLDNAWQFHSAALGDLNPNLAGIRSIEMAADGETALLTVANDEKLSVRFAVATLPVETSFGKIDLPVKSIRSIMVLVVGSQKAAPQLLGWWPLNEGEGTVVLDRSSSKPTHDGQVISGQGREEQAKEEKIWDNTERGQTSLACDGRHYVSLGNIHQGSYNEITIACWIKHESSGWQDVVERGSWGDADGIGLCMDYSGKSVTFGHYPEGIKSKVVVQDNRWHHVAGTMRRDGNDYVYSIYVDGKLDNTAIGCSRGMSASTGKWTIGARDGGSWNYRGLVNDVRIYDGALTEDDIKKIFLEKNIHDQASNPAPSAVSASNVANNFLPFIVDLSQHYTNKFSPTDKLGSNSRQIDGLPFEMGGEVILLGKSDAEGDSVDRAEVAGIKIERTFDEMHLLHSVRWREYYGCPVAILRLHYADGTSHDLKIRYNFQVLDWNRLLSEEREIIADPDTKIIKRSGPASWKGTGRLFKSVLKNPFPEKEVVNMDILSTRSRASYKLNAVTVAKCDPHREITAAMPLNQPENFFGGTVKVLVVDNETGAPIFSADINPYMSVEDVGVVADPILTSTDGVALVKYPVSRTSYLGVEVSKEGYLDRSDHWKSGSIPDSITYRLEPGKKSDDH